MARRDDDRKKLRDERFDRQHGVRPFDEAKARREQAELEARLKKEAEDRNKRARALQAKIDAEARTDAAERERQLQMRNRGDKR